MSSAPTAEQIASDATWLAQALDPSSGTVRLVAMDRDSYRAASFLDDRLIQQPVDAHIVPWPEIEAAVGGEMRSDARWIFHIGHVGSTLISRLLGEIDGVLGVREPRLLRDLALAPPDVRARYVGPVPKLMSRTFAAGEIACVKATSFASEIAAQLIPSGERALLMYARPRNYVASILAGENSLKELHGLGDYRNQRLAARGIALPPARNDAERAAAAWACEMTTLEAAADAMTDRHIAWADFDSMLVGMGKELARAADLFGFSADRARIEAIAAGPLMQRYSKALEYEYSPALRDELIAQEIRLQGGEIDAALAMLRASAEKSPLLARALSRAEE
ncbi:hypothetical protein [Sphingomonas sp.]|uniref:hypothetical protein n=1 Tax=Sphingomonas sp. TaxID=28214 RepID=UPI0038AE0D5C